MVKDTIRVVDLLNTPIALSRPEHRLLVVLNDLLEMDLKRRRRRRNYWGLGSRR